MLITMWKMCALLYVGRDKKKNISFDEEKKTMPLLGS